MLYLLAVSLLWAFSFGLIKGRLAGLDSAFIATVRLALALLVFLPFVRTRWLGLRTSVLLFLIGAVQFGLMYLAYNESFNHLQAHEVALLTLTTPVFVTLLADALEKKFRLRSLLAALLAVGGTALIAFQGKEVRPTFIGLALVQLSNLAFALGQVGYRRLREKQATLKDREVFAVLYAGGCCLTLAVMLSRGVSVTLSTSQVFTLLYLGVLASGVGFYYWNVGATHVSAGTLAVMNNVKIPLAVLCSLVFFGETADLPRVGISLVLLAAAVWLAEKR